MIGLDIGSYAIKAVELEKKDSSISLLNFKLQEKPQEETPFNALKKFLVEAKFNSKELNIAVSGHMALARVIELPQMGDDELKSAIRFEAEKFIPFSIENAILDYQIILKTAETKKITVLFGAAKDDFVKNYVDTISQAGFVIKAVDVDAIALTNAFSLSKKEAGDKAYAVLNMGDANLNLSVIYKDIPYVLRDISGGGKEIAEAIVKGLGVDKKEAYKQMISPSADKEETLGEIIRPTLNKFVKETRLSIGYFENQFSKGVETIYICGGLSKLFKIKEFLSESLDIQVESWDPFSSINVGQEAQTKSLEEAKSALAVSVGLAVRDD